MSASARRWVVREGEGSTVSEIVARAGGDPRAIEDGRVFVGKKRVRRGDESVRVGDEVSIAEPQEITEDVVILAERDGLVAVDKPAGMPTIADHAGGAHALIFATARALGIPESRLHPTSRLDRDVSGVVLFALDPAAATRLREARTRHAYVRRYVAIASKPLSPSAGTWDGPIGRAKDPRRRAVNGRDSVAAATRYATVAVAGVGDATRALLALGPVTGRTHQIRVHASHAGAPLIGDRTYGGDCRIALPSGRILPFDRIALHAARVEVPARARGAPPLVVASRIPPAMREVWLALGGDDAAWDTAASCPFASP